MSTKIRAKMAESFAVWNIFKANELYAKNLLTLNSLSVTVYIWNMKKTIPIILLLFIYSLQYSHPHCTLDYFSGYLIATKAQFIIQI